GPPRVVLAGHRHRQGLALARRLEYFGVALETDLEHIRGPIPESHREEARDVLAAALLSGEVEHRDRGLIVRGRRALREYWLRSGGTLEAASDEACLEMIRAQLGDVASWEAFQQTRVLLDPEAIVAAPERAHLEALPAGIRVHG